MLTGLHGGHGGGGGELFLGFDPEPLQELVGKGECTCFEKRLQRDVTGIEESQQEIVGDLPVYGRLYRLGYREVKLGIAHLLGDVGAGIFPQELPSMAM